MLKFTGIDAAAAAAEHSYDAWHMPEALHRSHIQLNTKVLAKMAIWEPWTFRSVVAVSAHKTMQPQELGGLGLHWSNEKMYCSLVIKRHKIINNHQLLFSRLNLSNQKYDWLLLPCFLYVHHDYLMVVCG